MKNSSSQPGRFGPLGAFGIAWRRFWLLRLGTWIQLLVPMCIQDSFSQHRIIWPHILTVLRLRNPAAQNCPEFCREVGFHLSCGSFWYSLSWTFSGSPPGHTFFFFFAFCHAKVETSYLFAFVFLSCHFSVVSHKRGGKCLDSAAILNLKPHHPCLV